LREKAKAYAKEMAYKDWEGAAANIRETLNKPQNQR